MRFKWDEKKNAENRKKHGVWFEEAQTVFADPAALRAFDDTHSGHEDRFLLLGLSSASRVLLVVHCYLEQDDTIRIVSARKAVPKERRVYEEGI